MSVSNFKALDLYLKRTYLFMKLYKAIPENLQGFRDFTAAFHLGLPESNLKFEESARSLLKF
jgi:hypothetical protein